MTQHQPKPGFPYTTKLSTDFVETDFETVVARYYEPLYRFALSLARTEANAWDLTQQAFYVWATRGHQLRDGSKVKTWLFTTLHRAFLEGRRRQTRLPHYELSEVSAELPALSPECVDKLNAAEVLEALSQVDEVYRGAVALFYLEDRSYKEIAEILEVPVGTIKSRMARGLAQMHAYLQRGIAEAA